MATRAVSVQRLLVNLRYTPPQSRLLSTATTGQDVAVTSVVPCIGCLKKQFSSRKLAAVPWSRTHPRYLSNTKDSEPSHDGKQTPGADSKTASSAPPAASAAAGEQERDNAAFKEQLVRKRTWGPKIDYSKPYTANIFITPLRAMDEFLLTPSDLGKLKIIQRRSPFLEDEVMKVYLKRDVEEMAITRYGSLENLMKERINRRARGKVGTAGTFAKLMWTDKFTIQKKRESVFTSGSGKVVLFAVAVNSANAAFKLVSWWYTGSHSMFSEFIHSLADTANQLILAVGIHQSLKQPDTEHPYGWGNSRHVASLISGVGIFFMGAGLSSYHGIMGLLDPHTMGPLPWTFAVLAGSFISEGSTLVIAFQEVMAKAKIMRITPLTYILEGMDPSVNVVLLEDLAAVLGVAIAASCLGITYYTGNPMADAVGSLLIGSLLGGVASFIIYTNAVTLVGRSILPEKRLQMMRELEEDRLIRAVHDVKATGERFKGELDLDGREVARVYLHKQDMDTMLKEMRGVRNVEEMEAFVLKHGENIVDTLGSEVDRIEKSFKKKHPEIKHVDLEQL